MSDKASAQQDLLKELYNYSATIIPGTETLIAELRHCLLYTSPSPRD